MKPTLVKTSIIAVCLLAGLFLFSGTETKAANSTPAPHDGVNCWVAGFDAMCDGTRRGFFAEGGATSASCNVALNSLVGEAQSQGCVVIQSTLGCRGISDSCRGEVDPPSSF